MLMNLGINSRDAMPEGGRLEIATALRRVSGSELEHRAGSSVRSGDFVELTVTDCGIGIAPEHLPHVFEPFFTTKPVGEGTGLGLATVHGIVTQCSGHVWATSEVGRGTRFTVLFPLHEAPPGPAGEPRATPAPRAGPVTVLLVEDDEAVRNVLHRTLESEGYEVIEARHGLEALDCLGRAADRVRLVLSDVSIRCGCGRRRGEAH